MWFRTMGRGGRWGSGGIWRMGGVRVDEGRRRCCLPLLMTSFPVVVSCSCYPENLGKTAAVNCTGSLILFCSYIWDLFLVLCSIYIFFYVHFIEEFFLSKSGMCMVCLHPHCLSACCPDWETRTIINSLTSVLKSMKVEKAVLVNHSYN